MARIRGVELPAEYNDYLVEIMHSLPDEIMADIGKRFLPGGVAQAHSARAKVAELLRTPVEVETWLLTLLMGISPGRVYVSKLTVEGLVPLTEALLKIWPRRYVAGVLLIDPRPDVQKYGLELVTKGLAVEDKENKEEGRADLLEFINTVFLQIAGIEASTGPIPVVPERIKTKEGEILTRKDFMEAFGTATEGFGKSVKANKRLLQNIEDQKRKYAERTEAAARQHAEEKKRLLTERDQSVSKARRAEKEKAALEERVRQIEAKSAAAIARGVAEQTSALIRKWLNAPLALERQAQSSEAGAQDVLARVEEALQNQIRQDHATGNRQELEHRLEKLRAAKSRLQDAASTALRPLPELKDLLAEVQEQILAVQKMLSKDRVIDPLTERLLIAINQAQDMNHARECSRLVEQASDLDLMPRADRRRLADALQRKFSLLEELAKGGRVSIMDHGWSLRDAIYRDRPGLILLDGFNILFGMEDSFRADFEAGGRPGRRAAERLITILRRLTQERKGIRVRVFFDSPDHQVITVTENLTIEYSGGQGEHRADQRIAAHLEFRRPEETEEKWFVVSDDRQVRRSAVTNRANPVTVDVFAVLLEDFGCLKDEAPALSLVARVA